MYYSFNLSEGKPDVINSGQNHDIYHSHANFQLTTSAFRLCAIRLMKNSPEKKIRKKYSYPD